MFLPPPEPIQKFEDDPFREIAALVVGSVRRLKTMADAMEVQIKPGAMTAAELTRSVRTAAHLHTLIIEKGGKVVGDVRGNIGKKKAAREA